MEGHEGNRVSIHSLDLTILKQTSLWVIFLFQNFPFKVVCKFLLFKNNYSGISDRISREVSVLPQAHASFWN